MVQSAASPLVSLGLTGYEASAYVALTRRVSATSSEVARLAGLPRQRVYDVLDGLVRRGLASLEPGRPARYRAVAPGDAVAALLADHRASLERLERDAVEAVALLTPAYHDGRNTDNPLNYIEVLRDAGAIGKRFRELQAAAEREILVFTKPPYAIEPPDNVAGRELLARGVSARSIYERAVYENASVVDAVRSFIAAGEQARVVDELPLKLVVIDERVSLFTMEDPVGAPGDLTILIVEHPGLAKLLKLAFEYLWEHGEAFG